MTLGKWKEVKGRGNRVVEERGSYGRGGGEERVGREQVETHLFLRCKNGEENWLLTNYIDVILRLTTCFRRHFYKRILNPSMTISFIHEKFKDQRLVVVDTFFYLIH
jgi:hypothetical protein